MTAAIVARFYGEGVQWALRLPLNQLFRWRDLMPIVREVDPMSAAVWIRKPPKE